MQHITRLSYYFYAVALFLFIGTVLPWVSAGSITVAGLDTDDGKLMLILTVAVFLSGLITTRRLRAGALLGGLFSLLALILAVYDIFQTNDTKHTDFGDITMSTGAGLYICVLAALFGLYSSYLGVSKYSKKHYVGSL